MNQSLDIIATKLKTAQKVIIALADQPLLDHVAGALALASICKRRGVSVHILHNDGLDTLPLEEKHLLKPSMNKFVISWQYPNDNVVKVVHQKNNNGNFSILVETAPSAPELNINKIDIINTDLEADIYISLGCDGQILSQNHQISPKLYNDNWYRIVTTEPLLKNDHATDLRLTAPSLSLVIYQLIKLLEWKLNPQASTNIISGIEHRTERYANPELGLEFFECIVDCLKNGGRRLGSKSVTHNNYQIINQLKKNPNHPPISETGTKSDNTKPANMTQTSTINELPVWLKPPTPSNSKTYIDKNIRR